MFILRRWGGCVCVRARLRPTQGTLTAIIVWKIGAQGLCRESFLIFFNDVCATIFSLFYTSCLPFLCFPLCRPVLTKARKKECSFDFYMYLILFGAVNAPLLFCHLEEVHIVAGAE